MFYNIKNSDANHFNPFFAKILRKYNFQPGEKNIFICSRSTAGKYCINFTNFNPPEFFNKVNTTRMLRDCEYYPKSFIFKNANEYDKQTIDEKYYYVKPQFGANSENISLYYGKKMIVGDDKRIKYPLIFQEAIHNFKTFENKKYDLRVHVIYLKINGKITVFYDKNIIRRCCFAEKTSTFTEDNIFTNQKDNKKLIETLVSNYTNPRLSECLIEANKYIVPGLERIKQDKELEIMFAGYDIIVDENDKHWILEINSASSLYYTNPISKAVDEMLEEILFLILSHNLKKNFSTKNLIKLQETIQQSEVKVAYDLLTSRIDQIVSNFENYINL